MLQVLFHSISASYWKGTTALKKYVNLNADN
uniref:Uncharacterized protein n=1 Tax=Rhizophora mucronata TaxID=61149 RepID=A0A2P2MKD8_RHIMU